MSPTSHCTKCGQPVEVSMSPGITMCDGLCDECREIERKEKEALQIANDFQNSIRQGDGSYAKKYTNEQVKCALSYLPTSKRHYAWYKEMEKYIEEPEYKEEKNIEETTMESDVIWREIENEYDITKRTLGKKMSFVKGAFKRRIIFRDIKQAYFLADAGFPKPAVILTGSVIEELLRLYLESKNIAPAKDDFDGYIRTCENNKLLKKAIHQLSDSIRQFRNLVHLKKEATSRDTISKATAKGAFASIFTIINDF